MMRSRHNSTSVKQNLDDLIVVSVSSEDQGGDVWGEGGRVTVHGLPALKYFTMLLSGNLRQQMVL